MVPFWWFAAVGMTAFLIILVVAVMKGWKGTTVVLSLLFTSMAALTVTLFAFAFKQIPVGWELVPVFLSAGNSSAATWILLAQLVAHVCKKGD
jgi:hypothetical protein